MKAGSWGHCPGLSLARDPGQWLLEYRPASADGFFNKTADFEGENGFASLSSRKKNPVGFGPLRRPLRHFGSVLFVEKHPAFWGASGNGVRSAVHPAEVGPMRRLSTRLPPVENFDFNAWSCSAFLRLSETGQLVHY